MKELNLREALGLNEPPLPPEPPTPSKNPRGTYQAGRGRQPTSEVEGATWNVWRTQAEFIAKTSTQRSAINKAIESNEPLEDVLLLAIECIATMTGDQRFLTVNKEKIARGMTAHDKK